MPDKTVALDKKVPEFALPATGGGTWKLSGASGRNLVVYFYPRDNTTGCTQEGSDFRDLYPQFRKAQTEVVGISTDSVASHEKFKHKYEFPFELLADEAGKVCKLFDVIHEKSMYGRKYLGVVRSTFLVDSGGVLRREWRKVRINGHAQEVLAAAGALGSR
jgi:peroxiredoxin Q/BCP